MSAPNIFGGVAEDLLHTTSKQRVSTVTLAAALVLDTRSSPVQVIDPGGTNRNVDLPAEADSTDLCFWIMNEASSDEDLTIRNDSGTTINILSGTSGGTANGRGFYVCDGTSWYGMHTFKRVAI